MKYNSSIICYSELLFEKVKELDEDTKDQNTISIEALLQYLINTNTISFENCAQFQEQAFEGQQIITLNHFQDKICQIIKASIMVEDWRYGNLFSISNKKDHQSVLECVVRSFQESSKDENLYINCTPLVQSLTNLENNSDLIASLLSQGGHVQTIQLFEPTETISHSISQLLNETQTENSLIGIIDAFKVNYLMPPRSNNLVSYLQICTKKIRANFNIVHKELHNHPLKILQIYSLVDMCGKYQEINLPQPSVELISSLCQLAFNNTTILISQQAIVSLMLKLKHSNVDKEFLSTPEITNKWIQSMQLCYQNNDSTTITLLLLFQINLLISVQGTARLSEIQYSNIVQMCLIIRANGQNQQSFLINDTTHPQIIILLSLCVGYLQEQTLVDGCINIYQDALRNQNLSAIAIQGLQLLLTHYQLDNYLLGNIQEITHLIINQLKVNNSAIQYLAIQVIESLIHQQILLDNRCMMVLLEIDDYDEFKIYLQLKVLLQLTFNAQINLFKEKITNYVIKVVQLSSSNKIKYMCISIIHQMKLLNQSNKANLCESISGINNLADILNNSYQNDKYSTIFLTLEQILLPYKDDHNVCQKLLQSLYFIMKFKYQVLRYNSEIQIDIESVAQIGSNRLLWIPFSLTYNQLVQLISMSYNQLPMPNLLIENSEPCNSQLFEELKCKSLDFTAVGNGPLIRFQLTDSNIENQTSVQQCLKCGQNGYNNGQLFMCSKCRIKSPIVYNNSAINNSNKGNLQYFTPQKGQQTHYNNIYTPQNTNLSKISKLMLQSDYGHRRH